MCSCYFADFNWLAMLAASIVYFFLGAFWYSPAAFGTKWMKLVNITPNKEKSNLVRLLLSTFTMVVISCIVLEYLIVSRSVDFWMEGLEFGLMIALGFVATTITTTFLYEGRPMGLYFIDIGYHVVGITLMGGILAAWNN